MSEEGCNPIPSGSEGSSTGSGMMYVCPSGGGLPSRLLRMVSPEKTCTTRWHRKEKGDGWEQRPREKRMPSFPPSPVYGPSVLRQKGGKEREKKGVFFFPSPPPSPPLFASTIASC
jgi:hypothetical protein